MWPKSLLCVPVLPSHKAPLSFHRSKTSIHQRTQTDDKHWVHCLKENLLIRRRKSISDTLISAAGSAISQQPKVLAHVTEYTWSPTCELSCINDFCLAGCEVCTERGEGEICCVQRFLLIFVAKWVPLGSIQMLWIDRCGVWIKRLAYDQLKFEVCL